MAESRSQSPKLERPEINIIDTEDDTFIPPGPTTRSGARKKTTTSISKLELDLSTLLKFIKPFDGTRETLNAFLVNCNNAYDLATELQKDILFKYILCQLQGKAQTACSVKEFANWPQLKEFLKTQFSERKHYAHLLTDLQECKQGPTEPTSQYALRVETCLSQLLTEISITHGHKSREMIGRTAAMEELALHHFQMGLIPRISNAVRCKSAKTLNESINIAISEEKIQQFLYKKNPSSSNYNPEKPKPTRPAYNNNFQQTRQYPKVNINRNPQNNYNSNYNFNRTPPSGSDLICRYCKTPGHTLEQCRKRQYNNERFNFNQNASKPSHHVHWVSDDPSINQSNSDNNDDGYDTVDSIQKNE